MLGVSWREHRTDFSILEELGLSRELVAKVVHLKMAYFGHVMRGSAGDLALKVMEGTMDGTRHIGKPGKRWLDNIREWSGKSYLACKAMAQDRTTWKKRCGVVQGCRRASMRMVQQG